LLIGLLAGLVMSLAFEHRHFSYSYFQLLKDGRIARVTYLPSAEEQAEITDFNGRPLLMNKPGKPITLKELQETFSSAVTASASFENQPRKRLWPRQGYADAGRFFRPWLTFNKTIWHLNAEGGSWRIMGSRVAWSAAWRQRVALSVDCRRHPFPSSR
jgi:hypothetical protein